MRHSNWKLLIATLIGVAAVVFMFVLFTNYLCSQLPGVW